MNLSRKYLWRTEIFMTNLQQIGRFHTRDGYSEKPRGDEPIKYVCMYVCIIRLQNPLKLTNKQVDKVRRMVHPKLEPFHFQIKTYYLSNANYLTDNPSQTNNPSLEWKQPFTQATHFFFLSLFLLFSNTFLEQLKPLQFLIVVTLYPPG